MVMHWKNWQYKKGTKEESWQAIFDGFWFEVSILDTFETTHSRPLKHNKRWFVASFNWGPGEAKRQNVLTQQYRNTKEKAENLASFWRKKMQVNMSHWDDTHYPKTKAYLDSLDPKTRKAIKIGHAWQRRQENKKS